MVIEKLTSRSCMPRRLCALLLLLPFGVRADGNAKEEDYYRLQSFSIPKEIVLEVGALELMPDGKLAVATRRGEIYFVDGTLSGDVGSAKFIRFAHGFHEVLGLAHRDGWLYATQRCEVSRLKDTNGDAKADLFETVCDDWGVSGDYHEYAFGSKFDGQGDLWIVLCLTGSFTSDAKYRGWCVRVKPDGTLIPTCSGLRSPGGIGFNAEGDVFYTDNQGPWNGTCGLKHLRPGSFQGHPVGNKWYHATNAIGPRPRDPESGSRMVAESARVAELMPTAVFFPYSKMGKSASGIVCDQSAGHFGPFEGQLFVGDQSDSTVMRVFLEKVKGRYQGACFPFRKGLASGSLALQFAPDGSLFVGGTNRGWGSVGPKPFSLEKLTWTGEVPFEIKTMSARPDGFELTFTRPAAPVSARVADAYRLTTYTYVYHHTYGSPEVDHTTPTIERVDLSDDGLRARLRVRGLQPGHVHELHLPGVRDQNGLSMLHPVAYYTLNAIPDQR